MNELIYNGQRVKIQLDSRDNSNSNTGLDLSTAQTLKIKVKVGTTITPYDATLVIGDNYSCFINYNITTTSRHTAWIYAEISENEKYIGTPFEFNTLNEGEDN
jgi:hypothetical protein